MAISDEEKQLLGYLTECIIWRSKYPVPLKLVDAISPIYFEPDRPQKVSNPFRSGLKSIIDELCARE